MRAAISLAFVLAACGGASEAPVRNNESSALSDVDVLPADESSATTSAELANGVNDPDVNDLGNEH